MRRADSISARLWHGLETLLQRLKQKFCLCRSIDRYDTDPAVKLPEANYHDGHKIVFSL